MSNAKRFVRRISLLSLALPVFVAAGAISGSLTCSASPVSASVRTPSLPAAGQGIQVADEIIRELRRLGLNFAHDRIDRPYDPKGELC